MDWAPFHIGNMEKGSPHGTRGFIAELLELWYLMHSQIVLNMFLRVGLGLQLPKTTACNGNQKIVIADDVSFFYHRDCTSRLRLANSLREELK